MNRNRVIIAVAALFCLCSCGPRAVNPVQSGTLPEIWPDYRFVTVPSCIAPLDFCMADESFTAYDVEASGGGRSVRARSKEAAIFPEKAWHALLDACKGDSVYVKVRALGPDGWVEYEPFGIAVSTDGIDYGLNYRLIPPGYRNYGKMGIYERELSSFRERELISNTRFKGCVNCHCYNRCSPEDFSLHIRGAHGATIIRSGGVTDAYNTKTDSTSGFCVYPYWHPSGDYLVYSNNSTVQTFHVGAAKLIEVFDRSSDLQIYNLKTGELRSAPSIKNPDLWETFPSFSPDGRWIYFCSAEPQNVPLKVRDVRYRLCRVSFDPETGGVGSEVEILADIPDGSISFPRPSFDGRFIMFALSDYGNFSIWHPESDLWILDLETGDCRSLDSANSSLADSYHNWSSNSRWFVLGSRRDDGAFTRAYICHISEDGTAAKPFLLPQKNPRKYYRAQMNSYNIPEFVSGPVKYDARSVSRLITSDERTPFL